MKKIWLFLINKLSIKAGSDYDVMVAKQGVADSNRNWYVSEEISMSDQNLIRFDISPIIVLYYAV